MWAHLNAPPAEIWPAPRDFDPSRSEIVSRGTASLHSMETSSRQIRFHALGTRLQTHQQAKSLMSRLNSFRPRHLRWARLLAGRLRRAERPSRRGRIGLLRPFSIVKLVGRMIGGIYQMDICNSPSSYPRQS